MSAAPHTGVEVIISCGLDNYFFFERNTQAKNITTNIFDGYFNICMGETKMSESDAIKQVSVTDGVLCYFYAIYVIIVDRCCSIALKLLILFRMFVVSHIYNIIAL